MAKRSPKKEAVPAGLPSGAAEINSRARPTLSWLKQDWIWAAVLFMAVVLAYLPVCWAGYIWDDDAVVTGNPVITGPNGLIDIWTTKAADICPLTLTTFWLEYKLWGAAALPYHLVNVILHAFNALLLWRVLRKLQIPGAWLGAALWALHPVEVESVAWATELKNTQSGLFFLLSIFFYLDLLKLRARAVPKRWDGNYVLTLVFAAMAMASKSSTVVLPLVLGLCAWWKEGRLIWRHLIKLIPVLLMAVIAGLASIYTQRLQQMASAADLDRSWPERIITAGDAIWFYLGKLVCPYPLMSIYPRWQVDANQWTSYLPLLAVLIVSVVLWLNRQSWARPWFFVSAYFLVALLPILGLVKNNFSHYSFVADHFQYLASMGPLALIGAGITHYVEFIVPGSVGWRWIPGAALLLIFGLLSWQRAKTFENDETLWSENVIWNQGSASVQYNLAVALAQKGRLLDEGLSIIKSP